MHMLTQQEVLTHCNWWF